MNSKAEFFRLAGSTVVIEYKNKSIITAIRIIEFGEKTTKFTLLNGDEVTIDNNQKLTRNSEGYIIIEAHEALELKYFFNRVRENEVLYQTALSIAYSHTS